MTPGRRDRLVSFRLSDEEYQALRGFCDSHGIRNLSDFARSAVSRMVDVREGNGEQSDSSRPADLGIHVTGLNQTMLRLTKAVAELSQLLERQNGGAVGPSNHSE